MSQYLGIAKTVAALIAKKGTAVTISREVVLGRDPVTQMVMTELKSEKFVAAILPPGRQAQFRVGSLEGKNAVELHIAMKDRNMTPAPGDKVTAGGVAYTIFWAQTYDPALDGPVYTLAYAERGQ